MRRPSPPNTISNSINDAERKALFGRPALSSADLPANSILRHLDVNMHSLSPNIEIPLSIAPQNKIRDILAAIQTASSPMVVIGKGAGYAWAEQQVRSMIDWYELLLAP
ncbi:hypothetical protein M433DRAFT_135182 [Acidomyces richmondensis BFW]|nr:MAG: hypothetical protein FE78DRAFT_71858 [Acidomyces sp. 'richmondensis']KYG44884.1 hypothetical protein M433DRAFT_135182 [Acidomyces richmondensis BFW]